METFVSNPFLSMARRIRGRQMLWQPCTMLVAAMLCLAHGADSSPSESYPKRPICPQAARLGEASNLCSMQPDPLGLLAFSFSGMRSAQKQVNERRRMARPICPCVGKPIVLALRGGVREARMPTLTMAAVDSVVDEDDEQEGEEEEEEEEFESDPDLDGPELDATEDDLVSEAPLRPDLSACIKRSFRSTEGGGRAKSDSLGTTDLRIVTYNVLGPIQAISSKHKYSPFEQRRWSYRKELIFHELEGYDADIVCLQEVTPGTFKDDFAPWFKEKGYKQQYYQPKRHPPGTTAAKRETKRMMAGRGGRKKGRVWLHPCLGTATFVKDSRWRCVTSERVILNSKLPMLGAGDAPPPPRPEADSKLGGSKRAKRKMRGKNKGVPGEVCPSLGNDIKRLADTAVLTLVEPASPPGASKSAAGGGRVLVANCHLFWNPKRPDIKTVQAALLCRAASSFLATASKGPYGKGPNQWPDGGLGVSGVVLLGDMNSVPNLQADFCKGEAVAAWDGKQESGVWSLLDSGAVAPGHPEHPSGFCTCRKLGEIESGFDLYNAYLGSGRLPAITTKTDQFAGCIDHIWCTSTPPLGGDGAGLKVTELLEMPWGDDAAVPGDFKPIPDAVWGSDHISLGVTLRVPPPTAPTS